MANQSLTIIEDGLRSLDVSRLNEYTNKIQDISKGFNTMLAPVYLRDFILAIDITNGMYANAVKTYNRAESYVKQVEAIAFMENAKDVIKESGLKDSAEARKRYVPMDPEVVLAQDVKARAEAIMVFLRNKLMEFRMAHDDVKKIAYSNDYNHNTEYEGM